MLSGIPWNPAKAKRLTKARHTEARATVRRAQEEHRLCMLGNISERLTCLGLDECLIRSAPSSARLHLTRVMAVETHLNRHMCTHLLDDKTSITLSDKDQAAISHLEQVIYQPLDLYEDGSFANLLPLTNVCPHVIQQTAPQIPESRLNGIPLPE